MKPVAFPALSCGLMTLLLIATGASAQTEAPPKEAPTKKDTIRLVIPSNEAMKRTWEWLRGRGKLDLSIQAATVDEHLVSLARAADFNFIADATDFPAVQTRVTNQQRSFDWEIADFFRAQKLSSLLWSERTFLLWRQPDMTALGPLIAADEKARTLRNPLTEAEMNEQFTDYFKRVHGWNGEPQNLSVKVRIADLPPALRDNVLAMTRDRLISPQHLAWFAEDFWENARIAIAPGGANMGLLVGRLNESGQWFPQRNLGIAPVQQ